MLYSQDCGLLGLPCFLLLYQLRWLNVPSCWAAGDMKLPSRVQEAMQMQVEAERKKRAAILESEGRTQV